MARKGRRKATRIRKVKRHTPFVWLLCIAALFGLVLCVLPRAEEKPAAPTTIKKATLKPKKKQHPKPEPVAEPLPEPEPEVVAPAEETPAEPEVELEPEPAPVVPEEETPEQAPEPEEEPVEEEALPEPEEEQIEEEILPEPEEEPVAEKGHSKSEPVHDNIEAQKSKPMNIYEALNRNPDGTRKL